MTKSIKRLAVIGLQIAAFSVVLNILVDKFLWSNSNNHLDIFVPEVEELISRHRRDNETVNEISIVVPITTEHILEIKEDDDDDYEHFDKVDLVEDYSEDFNAEERDKFRLDITQINSQDEAPVKKVEKKLVKVEIEAPVQKVPKKFAKRIHISYGKPDFKYVETFEEEGHEEEEEEEEDTADEVKRVRKAQLELIALSRKDENSILDQANQKQFESAEELKEHYDSDVKRKQQFIFQKEIQHEQADNMSYEVDDLEAGDKNFAKSEIKLGDSQQDARKPLPQVSQEDQEFQPMFNEEVQIKKIAKKAELVGSEKEQFAEQFNLEEEKMKTESDEQKEELHPNNKIKENHENSEIIFKKLDKSYHDEIQGSQEDLIGSFKEFDINPDNYENYNNELVPTNVDREFMKKIHVKKELGDDELIDVDEELLRLSQEIQDLNKKMDNSEDLPNLDYDDQLPSKERNVLKHNYVNVEKKAPLYNWNHRSEEEFDAECNLELIETLPYVLKQKGFAKTMVVEHMTIFDAWVKLIGLAKDEFALVSQWGMGKSGRGVEIFNHLKESVVKRGINLNIVATEKMKRHTNGHGTHDLKKLANDNVHVKIPDITGKTSPPWKYGIIHSKLMVSDEKHFYLGSANVGTRGTTYTKELGVIGQNCSVLGKDLKKIFDLYWSIDDHKYLPKHYDKKLTTNINVKNPLKVLNSRDSTIYKVFFGSSPLTLCADGRTDDLTAILHVINSADSYIYIAVNEYIPMDLWKKREPWTVIDDQIREAIKKRKVSVKFLVNSKASHKSLMLKHLEKLKEVDPYRVNVKIYSGSNLRGFHGTHTKMMVTDKAGFIGTSNWTEDYYTTTAGVTFVFEPIKKVGSSNTKLDMRQQMKQVFLRDFYSALAKPLSTL